MTSANSTRAKNRLVALFPELLGFGGVQEAGRQTAHALQNISAAAGWSADFFSLNSPSGPQQFSVGDNKIPFRGFARSKIRFVFAALRSATKNTRIILAAHPNLAPPAAWMRRFAPHAKIIVMSHGIDVWQTLPHRRRAALLSSDLLLAPSTYTMQMLAKVQGATPEKIRKLPWPLNSDLLQLAATPALLPLPQGFPPSPVILTVGRWAASEQYKRADDLIRALAQLRAMPPSQYSKNPSLAIVGSGDDLPRLKKLASTLNISAAVHFFEGLSRPQLAACYSHADIFALPSTGEGFGLVFLEAMAFAKPVVGAAVGGIPDLVQDGVNGFLVPHDLSAYIPSPNPSDIPSEVHSNAPSASALVPPQPPQPVTLVHILERLLNDPGLRTTLGQRGAEIVRRNYSYENFQLQLHSLLASCSLDSLPPP
jgi:phosphatidylinositol alpha-1,6-mannosyltransferase